MISNAQYDGTIRNIMIVKKRSWPQSDVWRVVPTNKTLRKIGWERTSFGYVQYPSELPERDMKEYVESEELRREYQETWEARHKAFAKIESIWDYVTECLLDGVFDDFRFEYLSAGHGTDFEWKRFIEENVADTGIEHMMKALGAGIPIEDIIPDWYDPFVFEY